MTDESRARPQELLDGDSEPQLLLASVPRIIDESQFQRLTMDVDLAQEFGEIARSTAAEELTDCQFLEYDPGHKLERDQVFVLPVDSLGPQAMGLAGIADLQNVALFEANEDFIRDLKFYAVVVGDGASQVAFFRTFSRSGVMRHSRKFAAFFGDGVYELADRDSLIFDNGVDAVLWEDQLLILNHFNFTKIFRIAEALQARVGAAVAKMTERFPISNAEEFLQACSGQIQMMAKAVGIPQKAYFQQLTMEKVKDIIEGFELELEISTENGEEQLVFEPAVDKRWLILKVLDDDYLNSEMTNLRYEVNSKLPH